MIPRFSQTPSPFSLAAFFLYGYAKNVKANISIKEREVYKDLANVLLTLDEISLEKMLEMGNLIEVI